MPMINLIHGALTVALITAFGPSAWSLLWCWQRACCWRGWSPNFGDSISFVSGNSNGGPDRIGAFGWHWPHLGSSPRPVFTEGARSTRFVPG